jgi:hypothetical protein
MKAIAFLVVMAACEGGRSPEPMLSEVENKGHACLLGHEPAGSQRMTFPADQPATIAVGSFACLSSSCTTDQIASCDVTVSGNTIMITTYAAWRDTSDTGEACTDDCSSPSAECTTPPLAAQSYTVRLGANSIALDVPSMTQVRPCLGDEF